MLTNDIDFNDYLVSTGVFGTKPRYFPDGIYFISSKICNSRTFCIKDQLRNDGANLINGSPSLNAHQCFVLKYVEKYGYYSIMALHSHKFLGVQKEKHDYNFTQISQYPIKKEYLTLWEIKLIDKSYYTFELVGTNLFLEYDKIQKILYLNKKNYGENQQFAIKTIPIIRDGLYKITGKYNSNLYLSFSESSTHGVASISKNTKERESLFYIQFDNHDGCYSIINAISVLCLSSSKDSKKDSRFYQNTFHNYDYQKYIISSFDISHGDFFFELKSNLLRLEISSYSTSDINPIILMPYKSNFRESKNQLFNLYPIKVDPNEKKNYQDLVEVVTKIQNYIYAEKMTVKSKEIISRDHLINCYFLMYLCLPQSIKSLEPKALENNKMIKTIECDPRWLNQLPNPLNIENIFLNESVKIIKENNFKEFRNLKVLYLPSTLTQVSPNSFENIHDLRIFIGNLKFINLINTSSLIKVVIPSFVTTIPKEAFDGSKFLEDVIFLGTPNLKAIESRAFANCESLKQFVMPKTVKSIAPDAFVGCPKESLPKITQENQRLSMLDNLIIDSYVTRITSDYSACFNIESLELPITVEEIEKGVFTHFYRLKYIKCDPRWLACFPNSKIEIVFIPDGIHHIYKKNFEKLTFLKFVDIPDCVESIEEGAFDSCENLTSFKCGTKHLPFLDQKKIKTLILYDQVVSINQSDFKQLVNLESLAIPENIVIEDKSIFRYCKKLVQCNNSDAEKLINNKVYIDEGTIKIKKKDFKNWTNITLLSIPSSVNEIEPGTFKNCQFLSHLICDPKFFKLFAKNCIKDIEVPNFVPKLTKGQFDDLIFLTNLTLPKKIKINDPTIFDSCENLKNINADPSLFESLSETTKKRCDKEIKKKIEYVKPIYDYGPEKIEFIETKDDDDESKNDDDDDVFEEEEEEINSDVDNSNIDDDLMKTDINNEIQLENSMNYNDKLINSESSDENEEEENETQLHETSSQPYKRPKETTVEDLVAFDENNKKYSRHIFNIQMNIVQGTISRSYKPKNKSLSEIAKVCGAVCYEISKQFKIIPRPVQILVVLRLVDNILNKNESHGVISEIKTGEGKSLVITIASIILVKYKRKIDIVSSNLELVKRDQSEQERFFDRFGIKTGVLYNQQSDYDFYTPTKGMFSNSVEEQEEYKKFNTKVLQYPVVYSTNSNFQYLYLHSIFNMYPRNREYDIVLVDEVDCMFIDESDSSLRIGHDIDYTCMHDILEIVFLLQSLNSAEIIKFLDYYFPNMGIFEEENIDMLKDAAKRACELKKKVDYIIENDEVVIIDQNTGFKKPNTRWSHHIHEMIEIKEKLKSQPSQVDICMITQNGFFNLYKKIAGVTGTIGNPEDESMLKKEYKVDLFRVPRHFKSQMKKFIKKRPNSMKSIYKSVCNEVVEERNKGRPVLIFWDSIYHAEEFIRLNPFLLTQRIIGINPKLDRKSIKKAGNSGTVTIATAAAGRGVDIKLSNKALEAGGLHVIIPMPMPNQRSLEQAAGRAGRQGQPGSVTFYVTDDDKYVKQKGFSKGEDNLFKLELKFSNYLRNNFPWMLLAPRLKCFKKILLPYNSSPSDVLDIMVRYIAFVLKLNPFDKDNKKIQDLSLEIVQLAWGVFFTGLIENVDECNDWDTINDLYDDFIRDLSIWYPPDICTNADKAIRHIRLQLAKELDWESIIIRGIKITAAGLCIVFPLAAPAIILTTGVVLSGGQEIYHQLQNGQKINWAQVLVRCGGSLVRNGISITFGIKWKALDMAIYAGESYLYDLVAYEDDDLDDDDYYYDDENDHKSSNSLKLSKNINGTSQDTNKWISNNINQKKKPKSLIKFKPKNYSAVLNIDFIRMSMRLSNDAYKGQFKLGKTILSSEENDMYKPKFYVIEDSDNLFVVTRGSKSGVDWATDFAFKEIHQKINGKIIYFHYGFHTAANYVLSKVIKILKKTSKTIYFVGHSYAGAVSTVLTLLTKSDTELKDKNIFGIAFAPPPAISYCPPNISNCIFSFINRNDIVTSFCLFNVVNMAAKNHLATKFLLRKSIDKLKSYKTDWLKDLIYHAENHFAELSGHFDILHIRRVKGKIYRIGIGNKKRLSNCRIKESQLPNTLVVEKTSVVDHFMTEYIKSFRMIKY